MTGAKVIFAAGLLSGSLDIAVTGILRRAQGVSFQKLLQTIANVAIGPSAFTQGRRSAALGLFFHFLIAFTASTVYLTASRHIPPILDQPYLSGAIFGILVHFFMSLVVVPLSRLTRPFSTKAFLVQLVIHILFVGLPIALTTSGLYH
ncbi:MAG TPA: hypothetical protein VK638_07860 [Edaphobacter sp.]|nr:hypothetical protein [Edaphobacter sp.]